MTERKNELMSDHSVSEMLPAAVSGCRETQSRLLAELQNYLLVMANQQLDNDLRRRVNPSDVVQDSMTKAAQLFGEFRGNSAGEVKAWLKAILQNELRQARRTHHQQKRDIWRERNNEDSAESNSPGYDPANPSLTPQSRALAKEELKRMYEFLDTLPDDYQKVIQLRNLDRLSFNEISKRMERSVDAVSKLWYRAILALQKKMVDSKTE